MPVMAISANWGMCAESMQWKHGCFHRPFWDETSPNCMLKHIWEWQHCVLNPMKNTICRDGPLPPLQGQAAIELTAGERWKWGSTVSIHGSSPAPQLCHFQSIAFRKSASTLQFEMKALFCREARTVYNDLTLKKHARFSEAFSPVAANYIICSCSKYSLNDFGEKLHSQPTQELRWCLPTASSAVKWMKSSVFEQQQRVPRHKTCMWIRSSRFPSGSRCLLGPLIAICIYAYLLLLLLPLPFSSVWIMCQRLEQCTERKNDFDLTKEKSDNFFIVFSKRRTPQTQHCCNDEDKWCCQ